MHHANHDQLVFAFLNRAWCTTSEPLARDHGVRQLSKQPPTWAQLAGWIAQLLGHLEKDKQLQPGKSAMLNLLQHSCFPAPCTACSRIQLAFSHVRFCLLNGIL